MGKGSGLQWSSTSFITDRGNFLKKIIALNLAPYYSLQHSLPSSVLVLFNVDRKSRSIPLLEYHGQSFLAYLTALLRSRTVGVFAVPLMQLQHIY